MDKLLNTKKLVDERRAQEWKQILVLIQAHQNLQEAEKKNLNPIEIKNITDDHTWELTKTIALGLDVDDLEEQATEIQNKIAQQNTDAVVAVTDDISHPSSSSIYQIQSYFYQTNNDVMIKIPIKNIKKEQVKIETTDEHIIIRIKLRSSSKKYLIIEMAFIQKINSLETTYDIMDSHIQIHLNKQEFFQWVLTDIKAIAYSKVSDLESIINEDEQGYLTNDLKDWKNEVTKEEEKEDDEN